MSDNESPTLTDESASRVKELAESKGPEFAVKAVYASLDLDGIADARNVVGKVLPTTSGRGRRSMKYCLDCNPHWNGSYGEEGTEAIGRYYVEDIPGEDQWMTGWMGLCEECVEHYQKHSEVEPLDGFEDHELFDDEPDETPTHGCEDPTWTKTSLVTEDGGFDWVECDKCGIRAKRHRPGEYEVVGFE